MQLLKISSFDNKRVQEKNVRTKQLIYLVNKANSNVNNNLHNIHFMANSTILNRLSKMHN